MWGQHGRQKEVVSLIISSFLTLRAFKQQVDSCYSDLTTVKVSHHQPNVYFSVVPIQHLNAQLHKFCSKRTDVRCVRNLTVLVSSKQPSPGWLPAVYPRHPPRRPPHADCLARDITSPDFLLSTVAAFRFSDKDGLFTLRSWTAGPDGFFWRSFWKLRAVLHWLRHFHCIYIAPAL